MIYYRIYQVYILTNQINGLKYIGATSVGLELRMIRHVKTAYKNRFRGSESRLHKHILNMGISNFTIESLEVCDTEYDMFQREIYFIRLYNTMDKDFGYNIQPGGSSYHLDIDQLHYSSIHYNKFRFLDIKTIQKMKIINLKVSGEKPQKMCVFKLVIGRKYFIWKSQYLPSTLIDLEKNLESKIKSTPKSDTELFKLLCIYMKKNRAFNVSVVVLMQTDDINELLSFEQEQLDMGNGNEDCLNNSFQVYQPIWAKKLLGIEVPDRKPKNKTKEPILKTFEEVKQSDKVVAPPFVKKDPVPLVNDKLSLEMPDFDVEDILRSVKISKK